MQTHTNTNQEFIEQKGDIYKLTSLTFIGYALLFISLSVYGICEYIEIKEDQFGLFFIHYLLAAVYAVALIAAGAFGIRKSWYKKNIGHTALLLNLFLISAYALNRELTVFANSTMWLCVYLMLTSITMLSFQYFDKFPIWVNKIQYFFMGSAMVLYFYMALYVANYYPIGCIGLLAIGIGGHIFVPLTLFVASIALLIHASKNKAMIWWTSLGIATPLVFLFVFVSIWTLRINAMESFSNQSVLYAKSDLPVWIKISETLKSDWISARILKSDLVYTTASNSFNEWQFMPKTVTWDEIKKHDPLVYISSLFLKSSLNDQDRVKILKTISDGRHQSNERLWSGDNLSTSYIVSDIDIYPQLRLAYTEKYLNVKNNSAKGRWWGNTQEGIYTFYLPEGSVVTSLSLWINGKEEKAILTSKQKAAKAYNTIVGVESRDPSVVHWQEGNTVTVRVFPCTTNEDRKFKLGITSPLEEQNGRVTYSNIIFRGPDSNHAAETTRVTVKGALNNFVIPSAFKKDKNGDYISEHTYDPDFEVSFDTSPITTNRFTFSNNTYSLNEYVPVLTSLYVKNIYLDINSAWTNTELDQLKALIKSYNVFVCDDESIIKIDSDNWSELTLNLLRHNFSLFPFYKIIDTDHSLVVTKGKILSPHLIDVKDDEFAKRTAAFFSLCDPIPVFNLGDKKSTYINSLRELRGLVYTSGNIETLRDLLKNNLFPKADESDDRIILHDSKMVITKQASTTEALPDNAPDHLMRLFGYNNIMRKVGPHYHDDEFVNEQLVDEASTAYVVSPVSSLIVLETQEDYKRFDINDKENSLHNASKASTGAVPEPHEWALIILFVLFVVYLKFRA